MKKGLLLLVLLFALCYTGWGQNPTNPGFETETGSTITGWTNPGSGSPSVGITNARTGSNALSYTTTSNTNQTEASSGNISVANNSYVHIIGWAKGNNASSRASVGVTMGTLNTSTSIVTIGTTLTQLTYSGQNTQGSAQNAIVKLNSRSVTSGTSTTLYWDDIVMYSHTSSSIDLTSPTAPSSVTTGTVTSSSATFTWTQGSDAGTGIQNTLILRTTNTSAATPTLNNQGQYSTSGGTSGPNTIGADWTILSISVGGAVTTYTDNSVSPSTTYKYAIIHRDLAYNFSAAAISENITTGAASSPTISVTSAMTDFGSVAVNTYSTVQNYSVSGANLNADISISPPSGFQISSSNSPFSATNPIVLTQTGGIIGSTTIYVRFAPIAVQSYSGNITHTSTGSNNPNLAVSGTGTSPSNPSSFTATPASTTQINLAATANSNSNDIVVVYNASGTFTSPTDGVAPGNVGDAFANGTIHYKGLAASLTNQTGLSVNQTVFYKTFSFDASNYFSSGSPANATTLKNAPTTQSHDITFSSIGNTSMTTSWTNGNGDRRVVIINTSNSFTTPTNGTSPSATTVYSGSGEQVIYNNTGSSVTVTGLASSTIYWFRVFDYNNTGSNTLYLASSATLNPNSQSTNTAPSFFEDFEVGTKASYTIGNVTCTMGSWSLNDAIIGTSASDRKNGAQSVRLRDGDLSMNFNVSAGARDLTLYHGKYGTDANKSWKLQKSIDNGGNWTDVGIEVTTTSTTLSSQTFNVNQAGNVRFRIQNTNVNTGVRVNIDDITITDYDKTVTTTSTLAYTNYGNLTINGSGIQVSLVGNTVISGNLTITNGQLIVGAAQTLTVSGTLTNSAGNTGLVIESGGSLINNTASVGATVKREIASDASWHFLSSPVSGQNICDGNFAPDASHFNSGDQDNYGKKFDFFKWSETAGSLNWINLKNTDWTLNTSDFGATPQFVAKTGYLVNYNGFTGSNTTKTFAGALYNGDQTITLTHSGNTWNLVGNPFPSAIDWSVIDKTNLSENYCYIYNPSKAGGAGYEAQDGGYIAAMQGFFVAASGNSLSIPNSARTHNNSWMKNSSANVENQLNIKLGNMTNYDETVVKFIADGNINKDRSDAFKLFSLNPEIPQVYTVKNDEVNVCINSLPFFAEPFSVPLGMLIPANGNYSIELSGFESFPSVPGILLEDLKTQATQNMVQNPVYSFNATTSDNDNRFILHFSGPIGINEKPTQQSYLIFTTGTSLYVVDKTGKNQGNVQVYNMMGQLITAATMNGNSTLKLNIDVPVGYYIVKVVSAETTQSSKVFMQ